jgi:hypothetical protein
MNRDEQFENRLSRQPVKPVPPTWRAEILSAAERATDSVHASRITHHVPWWRELFWPCPQAWAALATAWLLIVGLNVVSRESLPPTVVSRAVPPSPQIRDLLKQQERLFAELVGPLEASPADRPKPDAPRPRSARREKFANV